jgi:hypothetical protein
MPEYAIEKETHLRNKVIALACSDNPITMMPCWQGAIPILRQQKD